MREIKFRAWDLEFEEMITSSFSDGGYISFGGNVYNGSIKKNVVLMQYTGLKDKNGKEIYEGDILKIWDWCANPELLGISQIIWCDDVNGWDFLGVLIEDRYDFRKAISRCEVIGNIHENKNLL